MRKIIFYNLLIIIALGGCKKVDLEPTFSGDPVFSVNATLSNDSLNLFAGDDNVYMFSEFSKDSLDVYTMIGRFAKDTSCQTDCEESLSFSIRSSYATPSVSTFEVSQAIKEGSNYNYFSNSVDSTIINGYSYNFEGFLLDTLGAAIPASFDWEISVPNQMTWVYTGNNLEVPFYGTEDLDVQLSVSTQFACTSYYRATVFNGQNDFCGFSIEPTIDSFGNITLDLINNSQSNFDSIIWDGIASSSPYYITPNNFPSGNLFIVNAIDANMNCDAQLGICIEPLNPNQIFESISFPQFEVEVVPIDSVVTIGGNEQFSAVTIEYQDSTGIYSSKFVDNSNLNNTFTITKIEDYEDNENGEKTKKLTIEYDCILKKQGSGEEKNISGKAEIAVAYPD